MTELKGVDYFGRRLWLWKLHESYSLGARKRMFALWMNAYRPVRGDRVLDIGATPDMDRKDNNCMIPWLLENGLKTTLYSLENIRGLQKTFAGIEILDSKPLASDRYDWAISSAVLEHVGGEESQVAFIRECGAAAEGVFLTTPNRFHWLEFHTKIPLIHWLPKTIHRTILRSLGYSNWALESHLNLVSKQDLERMARVAWGDEFDFEIKTVWTLGAPSNLILFAKRRKQ